MPNPDLSVQNISDLYIRTNFEKLNTFFREQGQLLDFKFVDVVFTRAGTRKVFHGLKRVPSDLIRLSVTGPGNITFNRSEFDKDYITLSATDACRVRLYVGSYFQSEQTLNFGPEDLETWFAVPTLEAVIAASETSAEEAGIVPAGSMVLWPGSAIPDGWIEVLGQTLLKEEYPDVYAVCGTTWNTGTEAASEFRLPPASGRHPLFAGSGSGLTARTLGQTLGAETHQLTSTEMPAHTHTQNSHNHGLTNSNGSVFRLLQVGTGSGVDANDGAPNITTVDPVSVISVNTAVATNQNTGGDGSHNNMGPSLVFKLIIKT